MVKKVKRESKEKSKEMKDGGPREPLGAIRCMYCDTVTVRTMHGLVIAPWLPKKAYEVDICPRCGESSVFLTSETCKRSEDDSRKLGVFGFGTLLKGKKSVPCAICKTLSTWGAKQKWRSKQRAKAIPNRPYYWKGRLLGYFTVYSCLWRPKDPHFRIDEIHYYWDDAATKAVQKYEEWEKGSVVSSTTPTPPLTFMHFITGQADAVNQSGGWNFFRSQPGKQWDLW